MNSRKNIASIQQILNQAIKHIQEVELRELEELPGGAKRKIDMAMVDLKNASSLLFKKE